MASRRDLGEVMEQLIDEHPAGWLLLGDECICHDKNEPAPVVVTDQENSTWVI